MNNNNEALEIKAEEIKEDSLNASELLRVQGLVQTKTRYQTAVQVIKKRELTDIINRVEQEAAISGEDFYYSYPQGDKYIEGVGINGALILARNWGNNAVEVRPFDLGDKYVLIGDFIDFETGFNLSRPYILKKKILKNKKGNAIYEKERNDEIVFQIGTSKAMRNVILNALPNYVIEAGLRRAKEGYRKKLEEYIKKNGIEKARDMLVKRAERLNVAKELIEKNFGKSSSWDIDKILLISGTLKGIEEGYHSINDAFPKGIEAKENGQSAENKSIQWDIPSEIEKAEIVNEKVILAAEDWENPEKIIRAIECINDISELRKFKKENKSRLDAFGGNDRENILKALIEREQKFMQNIEMGKHYIRS
ncbi:MAG: hypothetical protein QXD05_00005 [Candidatus Pacearchaeota archaeon]